MNIPILGYAGSVRLFYLKIRVDRCGVGKLRLFLFTKRVGNIINYNNIKFVIE